MRADRLLAIMLLLQTRGRLTMGKLAQELEVSRRTILRDIEAISAAGVPIYAEGGHGGGVSLLDSYRVSLTGLKEDELRSLFVGSLPGPLRDVGLEKAGRDSLLKLTAALPAAQQAQVQQHLQHILLDPVDWWSNSTPSPFLAELQTAITQNQVIAARYEHADGTLVERVLEPYSLVAKANVWYLVARRDAGFRIYRVSRFHWLDVLPAHFARSQDFDLMSYWHEQSRAFAANQMLYAFTVHITPTGLRLLRRHITDAYPYHILDAANGGKDDWLTMHIELGSLDQAKILMMGLGTHARVIEPRELHDAVLHAATDILRFYTS